MTAVAELDDRIAKCHKILSVDPNSQIFAALSEALRKKGELDKAFKACQSGLKIHPNYGAAHTIMAKINLDRGQYDWAEAELEKARELDGPSRATDVLLAEIYIYKGAFEEAIKILKNLLQADPSSGHIKRLLEIAERIPQEQKAEVKAAQVVNAPIQESLMGESRPIGSATDPTESEEEIKEATVTAGDLIQQACQISGITGGLVVNNEGLIVEAKWNAEINQESCASTMAEVSKYLNSELVQNSFGQISWVLIEATGETLQLVRRETGTFVFVGTAKINLGPMRMKLTELFERYED